MSHFPRSRFARRLLSWDMFQVLPVILTITPVVLLVAFWLGGQLALLGVLGLVPLCVGTGVLFARRWQDGRLPRDGLTGLYLRDGFDTQLIDVFESEISDGLGSACMIVELDETDSLRRQLGEVGLDHVLVRCAERIIGALRAEDIVARVGDARFAICLKPIRHLDLEHAIQLASRVQSALDEPIRVDGTTLYVTTSAGFCLSSRIPGPDSTSWYDAAATALTEARENGPGSLRAFTKDMEQRRAQRTTLTVDASRALENGEIQAWFQPQISTETGALSGFEALARWVCPDRGTVAPGAFLPALEAQGLMERLRQTMLTQSLDAIRGWDAAGVHVPHVAINLSQQDLCNPRLADHIAWELDRADIPASRLCVEILETVVADHPDDTILRNIVALGRLGCKVDLDDYGTGNASLTALRRFPVHRIKIDRSFVTKIDRDPDQQRMLSAVLSMAERLELETLAEGVESAGENAFLAQLGCHHVQGFGIGRPMPFTDTLTWLKEYEATLGPIPKINAVSS